MTYPPGPWTAVLVPDCWLITADNGRIHVAEVRTLDQIMPEIEQLRCQGKDGVVQFMTAAPILLKTLKDVALAHHGEHPGAFADCPMWTCVESRAAIAQAKGAEPDPGASSKPDPAVRTPAAALAACNIDYVGPSPSDEAVYWYCRTHAATFPTVSSGTALNRPPLCPVARACQEQSEEETK